MILPRPDIREGDVLLGVPSSGVHSNGFSLVRKIIARSKLSYSSPCPWDKSTTLGRALLEPTRIYIKTLLPVVRAGLIKGMSHITGGGFIDNIPRVLPRGLGCYVDASAWALPPVFQFLMQLGRVSPLEMARTFNNGVGMVLIIDKDRADDAIDALRAAGEDKVYRIGEVISKEGVEVRNIDAWEKNL